MKKFNKVITVEVSVDNIANQLLATINTEEKHRELIAEAIMGTLVNQEKVASLYNALNGYTNDIDFKVGDVVECTTKVYLYKEKKQKVDDAGAVVSDSNDQVKYTQEYEAMGEATVVEVDIYRDDKVRLEYNCKTSDGKDSMTTRWVRHTKCSKIPVSA